MHRKKAPVTPAKKQRPTTKNTSKPNSEPRKSDGKRSALTVGWSFPVPFPSNNHQPFSKLTMYPDVARHFLMQRLEELYRRPPAGKADPLFALRAELKAMEDGGAAHTAATVETAIGLLRAYMGLSLDALDLFMTLAVLEGSHRAMFGHLSARDRNISVGLRALGQTAIDDFAEFHKSTFLFTTHRGPRTKIDRDVALWRAYDRRLTHYLDQGFPMNKAKKAAKIDAARALDCDLHGTSFTDAIRRGRAADPAHNLSS